MLDIYAFASSSKGNMYLVKNENTNILLECGLNEKNIRKLLVEQGITLLDVDGCLVTHIHNDHAMSIDYVSQYVDVYSNINVYNHYKNIKYVEPKKPFKINTIKIIPILVNHGMVDNYAYVFLDKNSCIFFGTDFSLMEQNLSNFKFDKVYIECNYDDKEVQSILDSGVEDDKRKKYIRQISTHMSKANCIKHLKMMNLSKCKEIVLLHASEFLISHKKTCEEFERIFRIHTTFAKEK